MARLIIGHTTDRSVQIWVRGDARLVHADLLQGEVSEGDYPCNQQPPKTVTHAPHPSRNFCSIFLLSLKYNKLLKLF
jgi:hypothetical protein